MRRFRSIAGSIKRRLFKNGNRKAISAFKSGIWQTDQISDAFVKGSDASEVMLAEIMDREVNVYFLDHCGPEDRVLDIGCGHGIVSEYLASHGITVTAIDISDRLLDQFRQRVEGRNLPLTILKGDAYNIPAADKSFSKVVARMFLPHFPDWPKVLGEIARVTMPGGRIMVHFPSKENSLTATSLGDKDCRFATDPDTGDPWTYYAETDEKELIALSRKLGLKLVSRVPVSFFAHNRIIGRQLGQQMYDRYQDELAERLKDEKVRDFVVWFDSTFTANAGPGLSHIAIVTFEKR
jgi:SAM-dependent methyltransferase